MVLQILGGMKYIIEAKAEATVWEHRYYEIEADSEEDAIDRCIKDGVLVDTVESDHSTDDLLLVKISHGDETKEINFRVVD